MKMANFSLVVTMLLYLFVKGFNLGCHLLWGMEKRKMSTTEFSGLETVHLSPSLIGELHHPVHACEGQTINGLLNCRS